MDCPSCKSIIELERIDSLMVLEFRARCKNCGWKGIMRSIRCGGCHKNREFLWNGVHWVCTQCGHARNSSPPHAL